MSRAEPQYPPQPSSARYLLRELAGVRILPGGRGARGASSITFTILDSGDCYRVVHMEESGRSAPVANRRAALRRYVDRLNAGPTVCERDGCEGTLPVRLIGRPHGRFCSRRCKDAPRREPVTCAFCGRRGDNPHGITCGRGTLGGATTGPEEL